VTIFIRKGLYHEKLHLDLTKDHVTLVGEDVSGVILSYDDHPGMVSPQGDSINTRSSHSFLVQGNDLTVRNITIRNDAGYTAGQAVALEVQGDRATFIDCRIIGNQDVLFLDSETSRQYYLRCYIEGTTDFIFGPATAWFEHCTIYSKKNSHVTAASTPEGRAYGFVFNACLLRGDTALHNVSLGRPWRPYASVIYMYCHIDGHIRPEGWANWNNTDNYKTARFAEYKNEGPGASAPGPGVIARSDAKVASRVSWAKELTDEEARRITLKNIFGDWLPEDKQPASPAP
jgi:pectinesterase